MSERATWVGICYSDPETFWWAADKDSQKTCPVCSEDDEDYAANHQFYVAAAVGEPAPPPAHKNEEE